MSESLQGFLNELSQQGDVQGSTSGFTLSSDKAREKLKKFALAHPENYFLLIVAGLQALGARRFELFVDADDLQICGDCKIERVRLTRLWENVAGGEQADSGLRLLGLAILTSVRFEKVTWVIDSSDQRGRFRLVQSVTNERIPDPIIENASSDCEGTLVSVKRRDVRGVASRFFSQLSNRLLAKVWEEERLLTERVFLGVLDGFTFNGRHLDCQLQDTQGLAMLKTGNPPDFLAAKYHYSEAGEQDMVVLIGRGSDLPGKPKKISWHWHGLRMGENRLGLSYDFCRAFVVADELRCDLSLTALADTWARQKAVRLAREATRRALERMAETYLALQADKVDVQDSEMESYLLEVLSDRIDIQRNRHRLGSFNDTLVRCPFFVISEADGTRRRASLFEIWEWVEKGKNPALFFRIENWRQVPAWQDRPSIIYAEKRHSEALVKIFGARAFLDGTTVATSVEKLHGSRKRFEPPMNSVWQGQCDVESQKLSWSLSLGDEREKGRLVVLRDGEVYFEDCTLTLPEGFLFYGEVAWEPSFGGTVAEDSLRACLPRLAIEEIAALLDGLTEVPGSKAVEAIGLVCRGLGGDKKRWAQPRFDEKQWLAAREPDGTLAWLSPKRFWLRVEGSACYYTSFAGARETTRELPLCLVLPPEAVEFLPARFHDARGIELHRARPLFSIPPKGFEIVEIEPSNFDYDFISRIQVGFPTHGVSKSQATLELNLRGHKLQTRTVSSFVSPVTVCLDIEDGWPDSKGCHLVDEERAEAIKGLIPEILTEASRRLLLRMSPETLCTLDEELQRTLIIDLWSEGELDWGERVPTSDGDRVSFAHLHAQKQVRYFSDAARAKEVPPRTVFLTSIQVEALQMVFEVDEWVDELAGLGGHKSTTPVPRKLPRRQSRPGSPRKQTLRELPDEEQPVVKAALSPLGARSQDTPTEELKTDSEVESRFLQTRSERAVGSTVNTLRDLLLELGEHNGKTPFFEEFGFYLSSVEEDERATSILAEIGGKPVIRSLQDPSADLLLCLLSALYSFFNRTLERVTDGHEREFHKILVQYASRR